MNDTLVQVLGAVVAVIAIIGAGIGVVVFIRGAYGQARITALREDNDDLRKRVDDSDKELAKCNAREDVLEVNLLHLRSENDLLREMVTQRADVSTLIDAHTRNHQEIISALTAVVTAIQGGGK
jgi:hypothetical protein